MSEFRLPTKLRVLVDDATSAAKRRGHGEVRPLHLAEAWASQDESPFDDTQRSAILAELNKVPATYETPILSEETRSALARASESDNPEATLIEVLADLVAGLSAPSAERPSDHTGEPAGKAAATGADEQASETKAATGEQSNRFQIPALLQEYVRVVPSEPQLIPRPGTVHRLVSMLGAREPQPVLLVGAEGSGRTRVASALAAEIDRAGDTGPLAGFTVLATNTDELAAAAKTVARFTSLPEESVLFIDDLELILPFGQATDYATLQALRSLLVSDRRRVVLVLSDRHLASLRAVDAELVGELEVLHLAPLSDDAVAAIAHEQAGRLEEYHAVSIPDGVITTAVAPPRTSDSHVHPSLAVRRLDRAAAAARSRPDRTATVGDLGSEVSKQQYVTFDAARAAASLSERIFGQDEAISTITDRLAVTRAGLDLSPERPDGVFLFAGPTGTGKTALARALAEELFGTEQALIRLDMSEYREPHSISKLVGSPPGYVGSTDPGSWLTTRVRARPHSLLLLDEIEKAHPDVWNTFLQVFDAGKLTDSQGNQAQFQDTVIIMTSNMGAREFDDKDAVGFLSVASSEDSDERAVRAEIERLMAPELLNRLDATVVFRPLGEASVRSIARFNINRALRRLADRGWAVDVTQAMEDAICEQGFSRSYGARPLLRTIEGLMLRPFASLPDGEYLIDHVDDAVRVTPR